MSDPSLPFLTVNVAALLVLGSLTLRLPPAVSGVIATILCGLGGMFCLPPLLFGMQPTTLQLPIGPPGLQLHLALDPLSLPFLIIVFIAGTAISAFQATTTTASWIRPTAFCMAGIIFALIAADGISLAIGVGIACAAMWSSPRNPAPLLLSTGISLLSPSAPAFDAIRNAPMDPSHAAAASVLTLAAAAALMWPRTAERCWTRDALTAGVLMPSTAYLLLRVLVDLSATAQQAGWGFALLLTGATAAVLRSWRAAAEPEVDTAVSALIQRQAALACGGVGLAMVAHAGDLPGATSLALQAVFLTAIGSGLGGTLTVLAAHAIGTSAGTYRLSRLGGLIHLMPTTSAALAAGLLSLSALPLTMGFAALWLLFQSILSGPRTGGLLAQLPLALLAAALSLSAALATTASIRLIGIALLGRPRTPRGSAAQESRSPLRSILLILTGASLVAGVMPGPALWLLADPAIRMLTGLPESGLALLAVSGSLQTYLALPVLALLALATFAVTMLSRRPRKQAGIWADGMPPPEGLPFGEPSAQSAGAGFLPALPVISLPSLPTLPKLMPRRPPSPTAAIWLLLAGFAALLLAIVATG